MTKPRILLIDIETVPLESWTWGTWDQNVGLEQIKTEWSIISYAAKWVGSKSITYRDTGGKGVAKVRDDKALLGEIRELLDKADIVVAQNGKKFDIKKINARLIEQGYGPYSPVRVIDTLEVAKKYFAFTSNKLKWLSSHLTDAPKDDHKKFPGFELWSECLLDNPAAWREMKKYNKQDIVSLEKVYLKMRPWIANHPNLAAYSESLERKCPKCDSPHVIKKGIAMTTAGKYQQFQCKDCGGWSRGKQMLNDLAKRKSLLVAQ